jgi:hypothetical protein
MAAAPAPATKDQPSRLVVTLQPENKSSRRSIDLSFEFCALAHSQPRSHRRSALI